MEFCVPFVGQTDATYTPIADGAVENAPRPNAVGRKNYVHLGNVPDPACSAIRFRGGDQPQRDRPEVLGAPVR
jgi:hypothetical protein